MVHIRWSQDVCAGFLFIVISLAAFWWGRRLEFGTAAEMGPGFMPLSLAAIIGVMGLLTILRSAWIASSEVGIIRFQALALILGAIIAFALLVQSAGFVIASAVSVLISLFAFGRPNLGYLVGMTILLPLGLIVVFILALGLPFDLWWG